MLVTVKREEVREAVRNLLPSQGQDRPTDPPLQGEETGRHRDLAHGLPLLLEAPVLVVHLPEDLRLGIAVDLPLATTMIIVLFPPQNVPHEKTNYAKKKNVLC